VAGRKIKGRAEGGVAEPNLQEEEAVHQAIFSKKIRAYRRPYNSELEGHFRLNFYQQQRQKIRALVGRIPEKKGVEKEAVQAEAIVGCEIGQEQS
jgi:hypothetical protein